MNNKPNCAKHKVPEYLLNLEQVANDIADMPYDKVAEFFGYLSEKVKADAVNDWNGGRAKLGVALLLVSLTTTRVKAIFEEAWAICKPFMK